MTTNPIWDKNQEPLSPLSLHSSSENPVKIIKGGIESILHPVYNRNPNLSLRDSRKGIYRTLLTRLSAKQKAKRNFPGGFDVYLKTQPVRVQTQPDGNAFIQYTTHQEDYHIIDVDVFVSAIGMPIQNSKLRATAIGYAGSFNVRTDRPKFLNTRELELFTVLDANSKYFDSHEYPQRELLKEGLRGLAQKLHEGKRGFYVAMNQQDILPFAQ